MDWKREEKQRLIKAFLELRTEEETARFLRDLLTKAEIDEFANRLTAAEMLAAGKSYTTVQKATGLSSTTVARVAKWLNGKEGGYRTILAKLRKSS